MTCKFSLVSFRLLDENDAEIQIRVLDCLLTWKDDFLLPYEENLKKLIDSKNLREELTTWSMSSDSNLVEDGHRGSLVPIVIRLLVPKVRKLKTLASRKVPLVLDHTFEFLIIYTCHRSCVLYYYVTHYYIILLSAYKCTSQKGSPRIHCSA